MDGSPEAAHKSQLSRFRRRVESSAVALSILIVGAVGSAVALVAALAQVVIPAGRRAAGGSLSLETLALFSACAITVGLQHLIGKAGAGGHCSRLSLPRRLQHTLTGLLIAGLYSVLPWQVSIGGLGTGTLGLGIIQMLRGRSKLVEAKFLEAFGSLLKEEERRGAPPAALSFLAGALLSALLFPRRVCQATLLGAALADPAAACTGELCGGPRLLGRKTVAGTSTCAFVGGLCGVAIVVASEEATVAAPLWPIFCCTGAATAIAELLGNLGPVGDDNFAVIFGSGLLLAGLRASTTTGGVLLGWPELQHSLEALFANSLPQ